MASVKVTLPEPRIGSCELTLSYSAPLTEVEATDAKRTEEVVGKMPSIREVSSRPPPLSPSRRVAVPLLMPADGELLANTLTVTADRNTRVSVRKGAWSASDRDPVDGEGRPGLLLTAAHRTAAIALELRRDDERAKSIIVDRAWVQSRLSSSARQDRAVFQLTTARSEIEVVLPADAEEQAVALVDGREVEPRSLGDKRLSIPLAGRTGQRRVVVELRLPFRRSAAAARGDPHGVSAVESRGLDAADVLATDPAGQRASGCQSRWLQRRVRLAVVGLVLVLGPPCFARSGRVGIVGRGGARDALPDRVNVYLFSSLGNVVQAEVRTAGRTWIVLLASGAALVAGLLLIYVPVSRHPATLLTMGMALLSAGLIAPEPTLLLAQAACLGLVLTLLAGMLERGAARRRRSARPQRAVEFAGGTRFDPQWFQGGNARAPTVDRNSPAQSTAAAWGTPSYDRSASFYHWAVAELCSDSGRCRRRGPFRIRPSLSSRFWPRKPHEGLAAGRRKVPADRHRGVRAAGGGDEAAGLEDSAGDRRPRLLPRSMRLGWWATD